MLSMLTVAPGFSPVHDRPCTEIPPLLAETLAMEVGRRSVSTTRVFDSKTTPLSLEFNMPRAQGRAVM